MLLLHVVCMLLLHVGCMLLLLVQEKQAAEASEAPPSGGVLAADDEAKLQQQLQELTAKIAELDEGQGLLLATDKTE